MNWFIYWKAPVNEIDHATIKMNEGSLCIIPPRVEHYIRVASDCIVLNLLIRTSTFSEAFFPLLKFSGILSEFFNEILYSNTYKKYVLFHTSPVGDLKHLFLTMYRELEESGKYHAIIINRYLMVLFGTLLKDYEDTVEYPKTYYEKHNVVPQILQYIRDYPTVSLDLCAEYFHFNPQYLSALLKKHTGMTYSKLATESRLEHAEKLLRHSDLSIQEIAGKLEYTDEAYFRKVFKKHKGVSAAQYRKLEPPSKSNKGFLLLLTKSS